MKDEKRLEVAEKIAEMIDGGKIWSKTNDDGSIKVLRVYGNLKGYAQIDTDLVNTNYIHRTHFQTVKDWLEENNIENIRRA